ncbi:hypothetical protein BDW62DRAFT_44654 [Aspergillus aurantiobrunneus]
MSSQSEGAPDLNSILRTLSAFSNQTNAYFHQPPAHSNNHDANEQDDLELPDVHLPPVTQAQAQPQPPRQSPPSAPSSLRQSSQINQHIKLQAQAKDKDPSSTITTWPTALKRVMRTVAQNEDIQRRIRFLIQRQHEHERQWWKGREALAQKQRSRKDKKRELDEVLRSVGAPVNGKEVSTAEDDLAEVRNYDAKVYKASRQMAEAMLVELKSLEIPFFCLNRSLIADGAAKPKHELSHPFGQDGSPDTPGKQTRLSVDELSALQQRMLGLLQDLCKE